LSWKVQILVGCLVVRLFINCRYILHLLSGLLVREFFFESEFLFKFFYIGGKMNLLLRLTLTTFFIEFRACVLLTSYLFGFILVFMEFWNSLNLVFFSKKFLAWICQIYLLETMGRKEYLNYINCCRHWFLHNSFHLVNFFRFPLNSFRFKYFCLIEKVR